MSIFLIHQESSYVAMLADSLGQKTHVGSTSSYSLAAPKLVHVAEGVYAAHAGTLQPAIDMLAELGGKLERTDSWDALTAQMKEIGLAVYERYKERFKADAFDVRVALVFTGEWRNPKDIEEERSSSIIIWEAARKFEPHYVRGHLYYGGSSQLSELATNFLAQPLVAGMLKQGPLPAAHALVATHAAISKLSSTISPDANVIIIGDEDEHTVLHGQMLELAQAVLIKS